MKITHSQIIQQQQIFHQLSKQFTQSDLDTVMAQNPEITSIGILSSQDSLYLGSRIDLQASLKEFQLSCAFLSKCKKSNTLNNKNGSSYSLKHRIERFLGIYITNGAIIAAAICLGIDYKQVQYSPHVCLAIKKDLPITDEMITEATEMKKIAI